MSTCALCGNDHDTCPAQWIAEAIEDSRKERPTLRDFFAAHALAAMANSRELSSIETIAHICYSYADAMVLESRRRQPGAKP